MNTDELPEGWTSANVGEIASKVGSGATPRGGSLVYSCSGIPLIRSMNVHFGGFAPDGLVYLNDKQAERLKEVTVQTDDVLLNITGASIGRVCRAPSEMAGSRVNQHVCIIRLNGFVVPTYVSSYLSSPTVQEMIWGEEYGVTRQALTKGQVLAFEIPIPPLAEQRRIVAAVERILDKVTVARALLARVPTTLNRFRQAVLAAACSGRLTADWRVKANHEADGAALLATIRQKRRVRWQHANPKKVYVQPGELDKAEIEIPTSWGLCRAEEFCDFITKGTTPPGDSMGEKGNIPFIKVYNLGFNGRLHFEVNPTFISVETHRNGSLARSRILPGDVLMNLVGPPLGKVALVPSDFPEWNCNQAIAIYRPVDGLESQFLVLLLLATGTLMGEIILAKTTAGQHNLTLEMARSVLLPLPPLAEQQEIVRRVSALFARADAIETAVTAARKRVDSLAQAVLAKAFRCELVPTEAELARRENRPYETATELLVRVRATPTDPDAKPKRTRKTKPNAAK